MGTTKTSYYSDEQNNIAKIAKSLGHPARVAIVDYIVEVNECFCGENCTCGEKCNCSEIVSELPLAQPTVSQHLKELRNAGIIKGQIEGNAVCYCIDEKTIQKINDYLSDIIAKIKIRKE
jgi:DNA-binding transcriptional ArsR family regulator